MPGTTPEHADKIVIEIQLTPEQAKQIDALDIRDRLRHVLGGDRFQEVETVIENVLRERRAPKLKELKAKGVKGLAAFDAAGNFLQFLPSDAAPEERLAFSTMPEMEIWIRIGD